MLAVEELMPTAPVHPSESALPSLPVPQRPLAVPSSALFSVQKRVSCACLSTCDLAPATSFLRQIPSLVTNYSSPWYAYLRAVYPGPVSLPFALNRLNYFYHHDDAWDEAHPNVSWPMATCDVPKSDKAAWTSVFTLTGHEIRLLAHQAPCPAEACVDWIDPGKRKGTHAGHPTVTVAELLLNRATQNLGRSPTTSRGVVLFGAGAPAPCRPCAQIHHGPVTAGWVVAMETTQDDCHQMCVPPPHEYACARS